MNKDMKNKEPADIKLLLTAVVLSAIVVILFGILLGGAMNPVEKVMTGIQDGFTSDCYGDEFDTCEDISDEVTDGTTADVSETVVTDDDTAATDGDTNVSGEASSQAAETDGISDTVPDTSDAATTEKQTTAKTTTAKTTASVTTAAETVKPIEINDPDYFKDALFIGDSRTVGLYLYGKISGAKYFGKTSASVYNLFNTKKSETGTGSYSLEEYLKNNKFGKIYILLGINEIGYSASSVANKYKSDIQKIAELQPDAKIIIQSNMHVTQTKSENNPKTFNNSRIDTLNKKLAGLADNEKIFYIDFVSVFDDETGNMNPTYSRDGIHLKAKSYSLWKNWLLEYGKR